MPHYHLTSKMQALAAAWHKPLPAYVPAVMVPDRLRPVIRLTRVDHYAEQYRYDVMRAALASIALAQLPAHVMDFVRQFPKDCVGPTFEERLAWLGTHPTRVALVNKDANDGHEFEAFDLCTVLGNAWEAEARDVFTLVFDALGDEVDAREPTPPPAD